MNWVFQNDQKHDEGKKYERAGNHFTNDKEAFALVPNRPGNFLAGREVPSISVAVRNEMDGVAAADVPQRGEGRV